jgi:hypothetical protein
MTPRPMSRSQSGIAAPEAAPVPTKQLPGRGPHFSNLDEPRSQSPNAVWRVRSHRRSRSRAFKVGPNFTAGGAIRDCRSLNRLEQARTTSNAPRPDHRRQCLSLGQPLSRIRADQRRYLSQLLTGWKNRRSRRADLVAPLTAQLSPDDHYSQGSGANGISPPDPALHAAMDFG